MRAPLFYGLCLAAVLAMAAVALAPLADRPGAAVDGSATSSRPGFAFNVAALSQIGSDGDVAVTAPPGISGSLTGVALATEGEFREADAQGARLLLGPDTRAGMSGPQAVTLTMTRLPDPDLEPVMLAVGFVRASGPIAWVRHPVPPLTREAVSVTVTLPATEGALALALWPAVEGGGRGFQLTGLSIAPVMLAPATPALPIPATATGPARSAP